MAYVEFRTLVNADGEREFDACAYTEAAARSDIDDLDERLAGSEDETSFVREIDWPDEQVASFNACCRHYWQQLYEALNNAKAPNG